MSLRRENPSLCRAAHGIEQIGFLGSHIGQVEAFVGKIPFLFTSVTNSRASDNRFQIGGNNSICFNNTTLKTFSFKASDSPLCHCNQTPETVDHFLFDCDNFKTQRTSFKDYCLKVLKSWLPSFATITNDIKLWCEMTKYVHQTKHLILPSPQ